MNEKLRLICGVIAARVATAASMACVTKLHVLAEDWLEDTYYILAEQQPVGR